MKNVLSLALKYMPLLLGVLILTVGSFFVPWREVLPYISKLSLPTYLQLAILGMAFYFSRILRYQYMLSTLGESMTLRKVSIAYLVAQPVSLLPAGEMYRGVTLKKHGDVPLVNGIPVVFVQSLTENIGLVTLALVGAVVLQKYVILVVIMAVAYIVTVVFLQRRKTGHKSHKLINMLPFVRISKAKLQAFFHRNRTLLTGVSLWILLLSSLASSLIAIVALYVTAQGFGIELSIVEATIAFTLPMILQNLTFLPGGLGVNEQGSVGILLLLGIGLPGAVALTLTLRFLTLGFGVILGLFAILFTKVSRHEKS